MKSSPHPSDANSRFLRFATVCVFALYGGQVCRADDFREEARTAMRRAVEFFSTRVAAHGGYVYQCSDDLTKREGEGKVEPHTVWVQSPGTPAVGLAYLDAYLSTREPNLLKAADAAANCLIQGQLRSGGWNASITFDPEERRRIAYRVDVGRIKPKGTPFDVTSFDDDKSQHAMRFLMRLDQAKEFQDDRLHEAIVFALESTLKAQYPNGGWPQGYAEFPDPKKHPVVAARYPETWSRTMTAKHYHQFYTLNDNAHMDVVDVMLLAAEVYAQRGPELAAKCREAALRGGDFLILAQMPEPQPAWAQQYDFDMRPCWARKFEPPAISGWESQGAVRCLLKLYVATGDRKYLEPIPRAIEHLRRSRLPGGRLARFYELKTNKPLYFTREYELTHDDADVPKHYGFKVGDDLEELSREHDRLAALSDTELAALRHPRDKPPGKPSPSLTKEARHAIDSLDERGAWVEEGKLKHHGKGDKTRRVIASETFMKRLKALSRYIAAAEGRSDQAAGDK